MLQFLPEIEEFRFFSLSRCQKYLVVLSGLDCNRVQVFRTAEVIRNLQWSAVYDFECQYSIDLISWPYFTEAELDRNLETTQLLIKGFKEGVQYLVDLEAARNAESEGEEEKEDGVVKDLQADKEATLMVLVGGGFLRVDSVDQGDG